TGIVHRLGIERDDLGAQALQLHGNIQCRRVTNVVRVGLERQPQNGHAVTEHLSIERVDHAVDNVLAAAKVDLVDLLQERDRFALTELFRASSERTNVLRQATATETDTRVEKLP